MASDKIFVDLDEEIVFTVEKIAQAASDRVIVVVPESANLVASLISLKLLSSQIAKSNKLIILVTEDKLGLKLSEKAGLISKEKISQIGPDVWVQAEEKKKKFQEERRKLKNELISSRQETDNYQIIDNNSKETPKGQEEAKKAQQEAEAQLSNQPVYTPPMSQKPRLDPKIVNLGNIKVLAGGDIEINEKFQKELLETEKKDPGVLDGRIEKKDEVDIRSENILKENEEEIEEEKEKQQDKNEQKFEEEEEFEEEAGLDTASLIGRDLSKIVPENPRKRRMQQDFSRGPKTPVIPADNPINRALQRIKLFYSTGNTRLKIAVTAGISLLVLIFLSMFVFNTASLKIYTKAQNVAVSKEITGEIGGSEINVENLVIPVYPLKISDSSSNTTDTTGNVEDGNRAQGLVTIYNKKEEEINLPAGALMENISTGLKYRVLAATAVPAAVVDGADNLNLGVKKDVSIQADSFGEKYNTSGTASYKFDGFTTDELSAKSFGSIEGGDTSEERAVSEKDITDLEDGLVDELKNRLLNEFRDSVADDEVLLEETITYGTPKSSSDAKAGEKADNVTVSLELEATAYFVKEAELKQIVSEIIKSESEFEGEVDLDALDNVEIINVVPGENEIKFQIDSQGDITADFTEEEISNELAGKSIGAAKEYLNSKEGVEDYNLSVGPFFLPGFMKSMPSAGKIKVEILTSK
ncbi:hypothetical protein JW978_01415 [Candidatus Dojkabacteria bacterium]|nr:hypothetical protein [Candidatus Dojkabacteria bacterium]